MKRPGLSVYCCSHAKVFILGLYFDFLCCWFQFQRIDFHAVGSLVFILYILDMFRSFLAITWFMQVEGLSGTVKYGTLLLVVVSDSISIRLLSRISKYSGKHKKRGTVLLSVPHTEALACLLKLNRQR